MADLEEIVLPGELIPRKMGWVPPSPDALKKRAGMMGLEEYLDSKNLKMLTRDKWPKRLGRYRDVMGPEFINDQGQQGACVGFSAAQSMMRERALRGQKFVVLSGAYIYDQINGGHDNGACITDSMTELISDGVPPAADYPPHAVFNKRNQPESRLRFLLGKGIVLTNFDEMVNAILLLNAVPQYPIQVGGNYTPGPDGKCGVSAGGGNHSVHGDDVAWLGDVWGIDHAGSWGTRWGDQGRAYHTERGIMSCAVDSDAYCKVYVEVDPSDLPPALS
jgi:hypothetical protein